MTGLVDFVPGSMGCHMCPGINLTTSTLLLSLDVGSSISAGGEKKCDRSHLFVSLMDDHFFTFVEIYLVVLLDDCRGCYCDGCCCYYDDD